MVKRPPDEQFLGRRREGAGGGGGGSGLLNLKTPSVSSSSPNRGYVGNGISNGNHHHHHHHQGRTHQYHHHQQHQGRGPPHPVHHHHQQQHHHHQLQPHPSWVYRTNYAPFDPDADVSVGAGAGGAGAAASRLLAPVKRSLSFLSGKGGGGGGGGGAERNGQQQQQQQPFFDQHRIDLLANNGSGSKTIRKMTLAGVHEGSYEPPLRHHRSGAGHMRHAVIRRHQSMYIHPRATSEMSNQPPPVLRPYRMQEVSGKSEVRPIVTLQRSKTTAGSMHYRATSVMQRNTFNTLGGGGVGGGGGGGGGGRVASGQQQQHHFGAPTHVFTTTEELCEFQAGKSFDLPNPNKFRRRLVHNWNNSNNNNNNNGKSEDGGSSTYNRGRARQQQQQQRQHQQHQQQQQYRHQMSEELESLDSCHGNIRYQAVEGLVQSARPQVRTTAFRREVR